MAYNYGNVGVAQVSSGGALDGGNIVRVFDVALGSTSNATHIIRLFNYSNASQNEFISITSNNPYYNSNAGVRFSNGCFVVATGCTATITYIREF